MSTISQTQTFPIVGIGASAGGLRAIKDFFNEMPKESGAAFVIIQHLASDFKSMMPDILSNYTEIPVETAKEGMSVHPNNIYLIPVGQNLTIQDGILHLKRKEVIQHVNMPIDIFFHSLGTDAGENAIGVILSGTGSDGSRGIKTIKESGGMIMVQEPSTSEFDGMINSAIATRMADVILPPKAMPSELISFFNRTPLELNEQLEKLEPNVNIFQKILMSVQTRTGINFNDYKKQTLLRRLEKRVFTSQCESLEDYYRYMVRHPEEINRLASEFLIQVTSFFRDMQAYEILKKQVFPQIIERLKPKEQLRIWVTACSTGEEAYSIAMLLEDFLLENKKNLEVKIFASDIDEEAISIASNGIYSKEDMSPVPENYRNKYFRFTQDKFKIKDSLRAKIVFARQNLIANPPFINMDLISCRNFLIYLEPHIQKKMIINFQFSLRPGGFLWLGPSESINDMGAELDTISNKWRVYQAKLGTAKPLPEIRSYSSLHNYRRSGPQNGDLLTSVGTSRYKEDYFKRILINEYAPNCIFITPDFQVLYLTGQANKFLTLPAFQTQMNLLNMVDETLALILRNSVRQLEDTNKSVIIKDAQVSIYEQSANADIKLKYHHDTRQDLHTILIEINEKETDQDNVILVENVSNETIRDKHIRHLEAELTLARQDLQATIEELETSNEELQASNEELLASNEELQSTNEELRSVNEELHTVNAEFQLRNHQLGDVNSDIENLLNSTGLGTIFLDDQFCIRRFTPAITEQFNVEDTDIGRPIIHFTHNFDYPNFIEDVKKVLNEKVITETEFEHHNGKFYLMRMTPYLHQQKKQEGVVITFVDITEMKSAREEIQRLNDELSQRIETSNRALQHSHQQWVQLVDNLPLIVAGFNIQGEFSFLNTQMEQFLNQKAEDLLGKTPQDTSLPVSISEVFTSIIQNTLDTKNSNSTLRNPSLTNGEKSLVILSIPLKDSKDAIEQILVLAMDMTEIWEAQGEIKSLNGRLNTRLNELEQINDELEAFNYTISHDLRAPIRAIQSYTSLLQHKYINEVSPEGVQFVSIIKESAQRMGNLVDDLLSFSRIGKIEVNFEELNLQILIQESFDRIMASESDKKHQLIIHDPLPKLHGDYGLMQQVINNLLSNAIKYSRLEKEPKIDIGAFVQDSRPVFYITDNGVGFDEKYASKLFKVFERLHHNQEFPGTGIGLAIVKRALDKQEGKIWFKSEVGKGATFYFSILKKAIIE